MKITLLHLAILFVLATTTSTRAEPIITRQPTDQSVSLGASATFRVSATTTNPPIRYQWQFDTTDLSAATSSSLTLTNIQITNAGGYAVVLADGSGSVTSRTAHLDVDPTFTKITSGPIVTDRGFPSGSTWGDYNNDGFLDLFVANGEDGNSYFDYLYRNNGDGSFTKVTAGPPVNVLAESSSACWGDYDNDGNLDLFVTNEGDPSITPTVVNFLYPNWYTHNR